MPRGGSTPMANAAAHADDQLPCQPRTVLEEIKEVLPQSYMIFLIADLRLMSGTGRIRTRYETLAIDSDLVPRTTAQEVACLAPVEEECVSPKETLEEEKTEEVSSLKSTIKSPFKESDKDLSMHGRASKGLSPRQVMAILLLELRDTFVAARKFKGKDTDAKERGSNLIADDIRSYRSDKKSRKNVEDTMESLLRAYARMISNDLVTDVPYEKKRRETMIRTQSMIRMDGSPPSPSLKSEKKFDPNSSAIRPKPLIPTSAMESIREELDYSSDGSVIDAGNDDADTQQSQVPTTNQLLSVNTENDAREEAEPTRGDITQASAGIASDHSVSAQDLLAEYNPLTPANRKQIADNLKERANLQKKRVTQAYNDGVDAVLPQNREANTQKEFEELTNVLFEQTQDNVNLASSLGGNVRPGEMTTVMKTAVESRDDGRLSFLSKLFKEGSVSQLMAESHARVVWINDWFPLKDLTYAIAVDTKLKRVLVVFRGAITATDWKMISQYDLEKIPNPVRSDYEGKKNNLRVFSGLYQYLFRKRKDTGTNKYDEIARLAHKYGMERIGSDYTIFVTGHSLGAALSLFFSFFASTEDRFTGNGPVKAIAFAGPYCGGHSFADAFRQQERSGKLCFIRVHNNNDMVPYLPLNFRIGGRGCLWRHVGVGVVLPPVPWFRRWKPRVRYVGKEQSWASSTCRGYKNNAFFHFPWWQAWNFAKMHTLFELQDRLMYGLLLKQTGRDFRLLNKTFEELYDLLEENDYIDFDARRALKNTAP